MKRLTVYSGGNLVGHLTELGADGLAFAYAPVWLGNPSSIPLTMEMPLDGQTFQGPTVTAFFENLLPEGDVLQFISKAAHISAGNLYGLLERFGGDTAGAFSLLPEGMQPSFEPHYLPVSAQDILQWFQYSRGLPLNIDGEQARMSLSGAQDKMTVFIDAAGQFAIPLGAAPSSHIIKPSISHRQDVPHTAINEALVMTLARQIGLEVAEVRYAPELRAALVTRYDRTTGPDGTLQRLHQQDICQVLGIGSGKKYESEGGPSLQTCFQAVLGNSSQPALDKKRLVGWAIFNVLVGNRDGHAKNLSLLTESRHTRLAPFYDLVCTAVYPALSQRLAFKVGGENRPRWLMPRHWDRFAADTGTRPQWVRKMQRDMAGRMALALPRTVDAFMALAQCPGEQQVVKSIREQVTQALARQEKQFKGGL